MNLSTRRTADGSIILELQLSEEQAHDLRRALAEHLGVEKPIWKPKAWVALKDRPDTPKDPKPKPPVALSTLVRRRGK